MSPIPDDVILPSAYNDGLAAASYLAHADDESFDTGPMLAYAASLGDEYLADFERGMAEYVTPAARTA